MFRPLDWSEWIDYSNGWSVADTLNPQKEKIEVFGLNVLGFQTHRDDFAIGFERADIEKRARDFRDRSKSESLLRETYSISDNAIGILPTPENA